MTEYNSLSVYKGDIFDSLTRYGLGWDSFFRNLNLDLNTAVESTKYPPYNLVETGENQYSIEMAVAGFDEKDISVEARQNRLTISGSRTDREENRTYHHQGLASRSFSRSFVLPEHMEVKAARIRNGILLIDLEYRIPESHKPRKIPILTG